MNFLSFPILLKNCRDALHPSGAKDDPTDAELLLQFVTLHQDKIKPWVPDSPEIRLLLRLVEFRRKIVGKRVRLSNKLTQLLKEYFPGALDWPENSTRSCHATSCRDGRRWKNCRRASQRLFVSFIKSTAAARPCDRREA